MNSAYPLSNQEIIGAQKAQTNDDNSMPTSNRKTLLQRMENIASLSQIVRAFGACAIIASMSLFMLQGWAEGNDITRYLKLLTQTGLLTVAGLVLSYLIKEFKGARVFFGLALISVVANFTILGSLTYSLLPMDSQIVDYPDSMRWQVSKAALFLPVFIGALSLLSAVTYFGFSIFSREIAKPLSVGLLGFSTVLLVPVRTPLVAVGLAGITLWGAWLLIQRLRKVETLVMTNETKASLGLLLLPGLIIMARAASFYNLDNVALLAFAGLSFLILRSITSVISGDGVIKRLLEISKFAVGLFIAFITTHVLPFTWHSVDMIIGAAIATGLTYEQLLSNSSKQWKTIVVNLTTLAIVPISLISAMFSFDLTYSLQALAVSGLAFALTHYASNITGKTPFSRAIASLGMIAAILIVLFDLVQLVQHGNWVVAGVSGAVLIVGASLYERFGLKFMPKRH